MQSLISQISNIFAAESINSFNNNELRPSLPLNQQFSLLFIQQHAAPETADFATLPRSELPLLDSAVRAAYVNAKTLPEIDSAGDISAGDIQDSRDVQQADTNIIQGNALPDSDDHGLLANTLGILNTPAQALPSQPIVNNQQVVNQDVDNVDYSNIQSTTRSILFHISETTTQRNELNQTVPTFSNQDRNVYSYLQGSQTNSSSEKYTHDPISNTNTKLNDLDNLQAATHTKSLNGSVEDILNINSKSNVIATDTENPSLSIARDNQLNAQAKLGTASPIDVAKNADKQSAIDSSTRLESITQIADSGRKNLANSLQSIDNLSKPNFAQINTVNADNKTQAFDKSFNADIHVPQDVKSKVTQENEAVLSPLSFDKRLDKTSEQNTINHNIVKSDTAKLSVDNNHTRIVDENNLKLSVKNELPAEVPITQKFTDISTEIKSIVNNQQTSDKSILPNVLTTTPASQVPAGLASDKPALSLTSTNELNNGNVLAQQIVWAKQANTNHVRLTIAPEHLGAVDINIEHDVDGVNVQFLTQHANAKEAIEAFMPRLKEMLEQNGLNLQNANVAQQNEQKSNYSEYDQSNDNSYDHSDNNTETSSEDNSEVKNHYSDSSDKQRYLLEAFA